MFVYALDETAKEPSSNSINRARVNGVPLGKVEGQLLVLRTRFTEYPSVITTKCVYAASLNISKVLHEAQKCIRGYRT